MNTQEKLLHYLRLTGELNKRAQQHNDEATKQAQAVSGKVPDAIQSMLDNERIFPHQKEAVAQAIAGSHAQCVELIRDLAKHRNASELETVGHPTGSPVKSAGIRNVGGPVRDFDETTAGQKFRQILMSGN